MFAKQESNNLHSDRPSAGGFFAPSSNTAAASANSGIFGARASGGSFFGSTNPEPRQSTATSGTFFGALTNSEHRSSASGFFGESRGSGGGSSSFYGGGSNQPPQSRVDEEQGGFGGNRQSSTSSSFFGGGGGGSGQNRSEHSFFGSSGANPLLSGAGSNIFKTAADAGSRGVEYNQHGMQIKRIARQPTSTNRGDKFW